MNPAPRSVPSFTSRETWSLVLRWTVWLTAYRLADGMLIAMNIAIGDPGGPTYEAWSRHFLRTEAHATLCMGLLLPALGWAALRFRLERGSLVRSFLGHGLVLLLLVPVFRLLEVHVGPLFRPGWPTDYAGYAGYLDYVARRFTLPPSYWIAMVVAIGIQYVKFQVILHLLIERREVAEGLRQASRLEDLLARVELRTLRTRLRPAFLSAVFRALPGLIGRAPGEAQRLVGLLGEMLRRSLRESDVKDVALAQELELLHTYLRVEQILLEGRLDFRIDQGEGTGGLLVPHLLLLPLAEEAVRRGIALRDRPGTLRLTTFLEDDRLRILLTDDAPRQDRQEGTVLQEAGARLARTSGREATLRRVCRIDGEVETELLLPLRHAEPLPRRPA